MAAKLIDERPEEDNVDTAELDTREEQFESPQEQTQQAEALPEKYQGKSAAELARMHQEAEKLLGRQSSEVGELRKLLTVTFRHNSHNNKHHKSLMMKITTSSLILTRQ
jgi:hypothetical protein